MGCPSIEPQCPFSRGCPVKATEEVRHVSIRDRRLGVQYMLIVILAAPVEKMIRWHRIVYDVLCSHIFKLLPYWNRNSTEKWTSTFMLNTNDMCFRTIVVNVVAHCVRLIFYVPFISRQFFSATNCTRICSSVHGWCKSSVLIALFWSWWLPPTIIILRTISMSIRPSFSGKGYCAPRAAGVSTDR